MPQTSFLVGKTKSQCGEVEMRKLGVGVQVWKREKVVPWPAGLDKAAIQLGWRLAKSLFGLRELVKK